MISHSYNVRKKTEVTLTESHLMYYFHFFNVFVIPKLHGKVWLSGGRVCSRLPTRNKSTVCKFTDHRTCKETNVLDDTNTGWRNKPYSSEIFIVEGLSNGRLFLIWYSCWDFHDMNLLCQTCRPFESQYGSPVFFISLLQPDKQCQGSIEITNKMQVLLQVIIYLLFSNNVQLDTLILDQ